MTTKCNIDGGSPFRIKRPRITTSGFVSEVDETIKSHLDELNQMLGKRIFNPDPGVIADRLVADIADPKDKEKAKEIALKGFSDVIGKRSLDKLIKRTLRLNLSPKHIPKKSGDANEWENLSLVSTFKLQDENIGEINVSDYIDRTAILSELKYEFQSFVSSNFFNLDYNSKIILNEYPAIRDYLIAYAFLNMGVQDVNALKNFILNNQSGTKSVANYAIVSAARTIIDKEHIEVPDYNDDDSTIVVKIKSIGLSLSSASFKKKLQALIDDFIFNDVESKLIDSAGIGTIPPEIKPLLIKHIKLSPVPIDKGNIKFFLPLFISQIKGVSVISDPTDVDKEESDKDFDVQFLEDDNSLIQISITSVKCAAQLYYGMILGDELDVFNAVNYFTHKYLIRGEIRIEDSRLRDDLQMYVFSNRFIDLKTKKIVDRTRPAERQMFYKQVFNYGNTQVTDDFILNQEFTRLWKVLVLESAKYLERAQSSFNPDSYVSRQNVMQAVEDLQYNLSTHCTGMANVITPMIYAELNFIIQRIFMHPEILRQVVPAGGTWWRVVETLHMGMNKVRPKATVLYNKAKLGHEIIRSVADYNPASFEDDSNFSAFISNVDAFITTQSILQEALTDYLKKGDDEGEMEQNGIPTTSPTRDSSTTSPAGSSDEWDF